MISRKNSTKFILILLVLVLVLGLTACGVLRLEYASLSEAMMKMGYKETKIYPESLPYLKDVPKEQLDKLERIVYFYGSTIEAKKDNKAYVFYAKTSDAAESIEQAVRSDTSSTNFYVYRNGRVIVYANSGGMGDIKGR